ncbi:Uncharacterized protein HZ326_8497 [Fusarium oxysporum f. sp. albedinis]|nr:Uncharacterized protein HZ326_8497 [Fusarium oxysporum f. sp. albedinis]
MKLSPYAEGITKNGRDRATSVYILDTDQIMHWVMSAQAAHRLHHGIPHYAVKSVCRPFCAISRSITV